MLCLCTTYVPGAKEIRRGCGILPNLSGVAGCCERRVGMELQAAVSRRVGMELQAVVSAL